ncbi:helix-turn-helix domain-containing protein [Lapillicoccus jejuensis]|uniref:AraC family transcriptional regulator n=1 Tax=Lapillicoccus jejuensis TaxID=402171 RepID=A0A542E1W3_9MICO|nr:helix-turn-helix domain-containing protein [Lapillicoccus jejuensis]TQJ09330.1 AraC family transcriptional regulator [Lapillicoccus jejuensis]
MATAPTPAGAGPPAAPQPVAFSTRRLPPERRVELWEAHNDDALIGLRCRTLTADALEASEVNVRVGRLDLARVQGTPHVVERDAGLVARRPTHAVALFFGLAGEAFFYHDDGVRRLSPGELLVCDADRPFLRGFSGGLEELVVKLPRDLFTEVTGLAGLDAPRVVGFGAGGDPAARRLARLVGGAAREDEPEAVLEATLLDLVATLAGGRGRDAAAAHRAAALAYVDAHLLEPGLSAERVAAAVGLSPRHLSRVLADGGTAFLPHLRARRLEAARRLLLDPSAAGLGVAQVARRCGFASPRHFATAFAAAYGEPPSELRRRTARARSAVAASPQRPSVPGPARHDAVPSTGA